MHFSEEEKNMKIIDWVKRMMSKFKKESADTDSVQTMELIAEEAPEPIPDQKTSDEMIIEMAEATLDRGNSPECRALSEDGQDPEDHQAMSETEQEQVMDEFPETEDDPWEETFPETDDDPWEKTSHEEEDKADDLAEE